MKKLAAILMIILYATASSGASFHFHFCMGKFQGIGFTSDSKQNQACDKCGMKSGGNGCCTDVVKTFKTATDQALSGFNFDFTQYAHTLPASVVPFPLAALLNREQPVLSATGPPEPPLLPIYLRDCTIRI